MSEDFDISQEFSFNKGILASFAPVNKLSRLAYIRGARDTNVLRHPPERLLRTTVSRSEDKVFITFEIWIFTFQKRMDSLQEVFIHPPGAVWGTFYYRCTHFISRLLDCWQKPAYSIARLGGARTIFNKTDYIRLKEESHIHLMLWGGGKHRLIFISEWTNPLIVCVASAEEESIKLSVLQSKLFLLYSNNSL